MSREDDIFGQAQRVEHGAGNRAWRVGIVGYGEMGRLHARTWNGIPGAKIIAIADQIATRREAAAVQYGCHAFETIEEMLHHAPDLDIVVVATQAPLHCLHTLLAIQKQHHVICEKPMALSLRDCDTMVDAAKSAGVALAVHHQHIFSKAVEHADELIAQGAIGRLYGIYATGKGRLACYDLMEIGVHSLHLMHYFAGGELDAIEGEVLEMGKRVRVTEYDIRDIKSLYPEGRDSGKGAGDYIYGRYHFTSGVRGVLELATVELPEHTSRYMSFTLRGTKGQLRINFPSRSALFYNREALDSMEGGGWGEFDPGRTRDHDSSYAYSMQQFARDFIESIVARIAPKVSGEEGRAAIEMSYGIYAAHFSASAIFAPRIADYVYSLASFAS